MRSTLHARRVFPIALAILAVLASLLWSGHAWLLAVAAMFLLGRSYGGHSHAQSSSNQATYGVGAALVGFMPEDRG
jgi:hypothetical protein